MGAREKMVAALGGGGAIERAVESFLMEHRLEWAEKIRAVNITPSGHPSYDDGKDAGLDLAAEILEGA